MTEFYIDTQEQLLTFCESIKDSQWLALDTEFLREKTYYPKFCLLQISNGQISACVDPLRLDDLSPIKNILFNTNIVKVLHAAHQDLEIFHLLWDKIPAPIFDTQLAAAITGYGDQMGYARLVSQLLNVTLEKDQARTDWSKRPLDKAQQQYALNDVTFLGEIYLLLDAKIKKLDRENWLDAEYQHFNNPATFQIASDDAWKKVKGRQHLKGVQYAVLQKLADWREVRAIKSDRPRRWIMKDEVLIDLARRTPEKSHLLSKIRGIEEGLIRKHGDEIINIIQSAKQIPQESWPSDNIPIRQLTKQEEALGDLMMCALRLIAAEHQLTAAVIANKKDLEKLITGAQDTALLDGWRKRIAGDHLKQIQQGELLPCWDADNNLTLCPTT